MKALASVSRRGLAAVEAITYSSSGCVAVLPTKAIAPCFDTENGGWTSVSPRLSFFAGCASGCSHSDVRVPSSPSSNKAWAPGSHA